MIVILVDSFGSVVETANDPSLPRAIVIACLRAVGAQQPDEEKDNVL